MNGGLRIDSLCSELIARTADIPPTVSQCLALLLDLADPVVKASH